MNNTLLSINEWIDIPFYKGYKINPSTGEIKGLKGNKVKPANGSFVFKTEFGRKRTRINKILFAMQNNIQLNQIDDRYVIKIVDGKFLIQESWILSHESFNKNFKIKREYHKSNIIDYYKESRKFIDMLITAYKENDFIEIEKYLEEIRNELILYAAKISKTRKERVEIIVEKISIDILNRIKNKDCCFLDLKGYIKGVIRKSLKYYRNESKQTKMLLFGA